MDPLPTVDMAYATIKREISRRKIMTGVSSPGLDPSEMGSGLVMKNKNFPRNRESDNRQKLRCSQGRLFQASWVPRLVGWPTKEEGRHQGTGVSDRRQGQPSYYRSPGEITSSHEHSDMDMGKGEAGIIELVTSKRKEERETTEHHGERDTYKPSLTPLNTTPPSSQNPFNPKKKLPGPNPTPQPNLIPKFSLMVRGLCTSPEIG